MTTTEQVIAFSTVRKGYEPAEVDSYLAGLRKGYTAELENERQRVRELEAQLAVAREREEAVHLTLVAATRTRDEMVAAAESRLEEATAAANAEADKILQQAKMEAFRLVTEARQDADQTLAEARERANAVPVATAEAERIIAEARREAMALLTVAKEDAESRIEPPVAVAPVIAEIPIDQSPNGTRGSFYSRRSAKLPRIGDESGRNTLTSMSGLRSQINATTFADVEDDDQEEGDHRGAGDLAVQPA